MVDAAVDDAKRSKLDFHRRVGVDFTRLAAIVLLLEIVGKDGTVAATVALCKEVDAEVGVISRAVLRECLHEALKQVPHGVRCNLCAVGGVALLLGAEGAIDTKPWAAGVIGLGGREGVRIIDHVVGAVSGDIIRQADLVGLYMC